MRDVFLVLHIIYIGISKNTQHLRHLRHLSQRDVERFSGVVGVVGVGCYFFFDNIYIFTAENPDEIGDFCEGEADVG